MDFSINLYTQATKILKCTKKHCTTRIVLGYIHCEMLYAISNVFSTEC